MLRTVEGNAKSRFKIPLVISSPVLPENIVTSLTSELRHVKTKIVTEGKDVFVECNVESNVTSAGTLTVTDSLTKRRASIPVIVDREPAVTVSPSVMYFVRSKDKENVYSATSIIAINKEFLSFEGNGKEESPIDFQCRVDGLRVQAEAKRLAVGIYRVTSSFAVDAKVEVPVAMPEEAVWTFRTGSLI